MSSLKLNRSNAITKVGAPNCDKVELTQNTQLRSSKCRRYTYQSGHLVGCASDANSGRTGGEGMIASTRARTRSRDLPLSPRSARMRRVHPEEAIISSLLHKLNNTFPYNIALQLLIEALE